MLVGSSVPNHPLGRLGQKIVGPVRDRFDRVLNGTAPCQRNDFGRSIAFHQLIQHG